MNCKDTQKKQYANFYFIFLLFSFRQIFITRPYCHFPTIFFSPSSISQPFTPSLPPFSHLYSHAPNPLSHCLSPRPPLLFFPTAIEFLPDRYCISSWPLLYFFLTAILLLSIHFFSPSQPLSFPLKTISAQPYSPSPHSESSFRFQPVLIASSLHPFFPVFTLPIPAPLSCTIPSLIVRCSFAHHSRPFNSCFAWNSP